VCRPLRPLFDWHRLDRDESTAVAGVFLVPPEVGFVQFFFQFFDIGHRLDDNTRFAIDHPVNCIRLLAVTADDVCDEMFFH